MADFSDRVFVFNGATLQAALDDWTAEQIAAYPHREEQIRVTALAMRDFLSSSHVARHKMIMPGKRSRAGAEGTRTLDRNRS